MLAAAKEGKVTALLQAPARPETGRALAAAFNERFKLAIQVDWVVAPTATPNMRAAAALAVVPVLGLMAAIQAQERPQVSPYR